MSSENTYDLFSLFTPTYTGRSSSIPKIRKESRKLHAENSLIAGFTRQYAQLIISDGVSINMNGTRQTVKQIKQLWNEYIRMVSVDDQSLDAFITSIVQEMVVAGDVLVYITTRTNPYTGNIEPKLNHILAERVKTPPVENLKRIFDVKLKQYIDLSSNFVQDGVMLSEGEILGYCVEPINEFDTWRFFPKIFDRNLCAVLIQDPIKKHMETKRGVPMMASGMQTITNLMDIKRSEVAASQLRTKISFVISSDMSMLEGIDPTSEKGKSIQAAIKTEVDAFMASLKTRDTNGVYKPLGTNLEMKDPKNNINAEIEKALTPYIREIASLYGINYASLAQDSRAETSITARLAYQMSFALTEPIRQYLYNSIVRPLFKQWMELSGFDIKEITFDFTTKQYGFSKSKEIYDAEKVAVEAGFKSIPQAIADLGMDYNDVMESTEMWILDTKKEEGAEGDINV